VLRAELVILAAVTTEVIAHLAFCAGWPSAMWAAQASLYADRKSENRSNGEAMSKDNVVVGFVGLGTMGGCMAANVQRAGFKLVVHDLHRQAASHHLAAGAIWADSPRALAREADVIFSSLPEPSDVEAVALGETASSLASSPALPISTCRPIRRAL
jgi:phosphoglycerate dehydrogenase-like enzyme